MADTYIDAVIRKICNREGAYTNDPQDPGGPTKYGITQKTLASWRKHSVTPSDVKNLELSEACLIYKTLYVKAPGYLDLGDDPMAEQLIDAGVNLGTVTAIRLLQRVLGVARTGKIDQPTVAKYKQTNPKWQIFTQFMAERLSAYSAIMKRNPSQVKWAGGWLNRCVELTNIYVLAVTFDTAIEGKILQAAHLGHQESLRIQGSPTARKDSANIFAGVAKFYNNVKA
ncbi:MAG: hypothetical protein EKK48_07910 [Candidatus Melainabacteria bacterium]|nr:MAG: hypothetical protein EKK48_07910 [Candidatus Melainabacteria bacterium]